MMRPARILIVLIALMALAAPIRPVFAQTATPTATATATCVAPWNKASEVVVLTDFVTLTRPMLIYPSYIELISGSGTASNYGGYSYNWINPGDRYYSSGQATGSVDLAVSGSVLICYAQADSTATATTPTATPTATATPIPTVVLDIPNLGDTTLSMGEQFITFTAGPDMTILLLLAAVVIGFWILPMLRELITWHHD